MSGTVERKGTSTGAKVAIVVIIFVVMGFIVDSMNHWHLVHQFLGH